MKFLDCVYQGGLFAVKSLRLQKSSLEQTWRHLSFTTSLGRKQCWRLSSTFGCIIGSLPTAQPSSICDMKVSEILEKGTKAVSPNWDFDCEYECRQLLSILWLSLGYPAGLVVTNGTSEATEKKYDLYWKDSTKKGWTRMKVGDCWAREWRMFRKG